MVSTSRRRFLGSTFAAAAGGPVLTHAADPVATPGQFKEPAKILPSRDDADVIVCGGGPAGFAAAVSAARTGAHARLFEVHGCLGGVWTAGLLTYTFDFDKPGLTAELVRLLDERDARRNSNPGQFVYHPDEMKLILEELCTAAGVDVHLHTRVTAAYREGRRLSTVVTESKSGRQAWQAPVFIDATGDGDLGALADCGWEIGRGGENCPCQPLTLNALALLPQVPALGECISFYNDSKRHQEAVAEFRKHLERAGVKTSYGDPTLFHIRDSLVMLMINHEYGVKAFDEPAITAATMRARAEVFKIARALRALGGPWSGFQIVASAEQIGIRDGRRIRGRYTVTKDDLIKGARHEDGIARATFGADIHAADHDENAATAVSHGGFKTRPYDIPLRALIAQDVDGLLLAGRCISGDFFAHASYRVTGNAVAMGEAAGALAALAAKTKRAPHEVPWADVAGALARLRHA